MTTERKNLADRTNTCAIGNSNHAKVEKFGRPTFGEIFQDLHFEAVIDPQNPQSLQLHSRDGTRLSTSPQIEHHGQTYVPAKLTEGLAQIVRFPLPSTEFSSPQKLTDAMAELFCTFGRTTKENSNILAVWALSTWFVDCFRIAPILHLTGPSTRVRLMMRLLACLCRRPLLLGRLDLASLSTLPEGLNPTLLIYEERLAKNVARILETSRNQDLAIPYGKSWIHAYGARVLFSDPNVMNASDLRVHFAPTAGAFPELKDDAERTIAADFQAKLLRYRIVNFVAVRNSQFDCSGFVPDMQDDVRALVTPLIDCGDFRESILSLLLSRSKDRAGARFTDLNCLVTEAALAFCHDPAVEEFFVKELTDIANDISRGRNEDQTITAKAVGQPLRGLGLFPVRVTDGYHLVLTNSIREKIHRLAEDYNVPSLDEGTRRCDDCKPPDLPAEKR